MAKNRLEATLAFSIPVRGRLSVATEKGTVFTASLEAYRRSHEAPMDGIDGRITQLTAHLQTPLGETVETDLAGGLRKVASATRSAFRFQTENLVADAGVTSWALVKGTRQLAGAKRPEAGEDRTAKRLVRFNQGKRFEEYLQAKGITDAEKRLRPFLPFMLTEALLPFDLRQDLYEGAMEIVKIHLLARGRSFPLRPPPRTAAGHLPHRPGPG